MSGLQILVDIGMTLLIIAVVPQIWKTWKSRNDIKGIDFRFMTLTAAGNILAIAWAILVQQWTIGILNGIYLIWTFLSLICVLRMIEGHMSLMDLIKGGA